MEKTEQQKRFEQVDSWAVVDQQQPWAWAYLLPDGSKRATASETDRDQLASIGVHLSPLYASGQLHFGIVKGFQLGEASALDRAANVCEGMALGGIPVQHMPDGDVVYEPAFAIDCAEAIRALAQEVGK